MSLERPRHQTFSRRAMLGGMIPIVGGAAAAAVFGFRKAGDGDYEMPTIQAVTTTTPAVERRPTPTATPDTIISPEFRSQMIAAIQAKTAAVNTFIHPSLAKTNPENIPLALLTDLELYALRRKDPMHVSLGPDGTQRIFIINELDNSHKITTHTLMEAQINPDALPELPPHFQNGQIIPDRLKDVASAFFRISKDVGLTGLSWFPTEIQGEGNTKIPAIIAVGTSAKGDVIQIYIDSTGAASLEYSNASYKPFPVVP